jgi:hypothetical protein
MAFNFYIGSPINSIIEYEKDGADPMDSAMDWLQSQMGALCGSIAKRERCESCLGISPPFVRNLLHKMNNLYFISMCNFTSNLTELGITLL